MSQWYLPKAESEWLTSQGKGFLLKLVRREMAGGEPPSVLEAVHSPDATFVAAKPRLLTGAELLHPRKP
jgi:hypothetical protein